jgi:hypothetical protein
MVRQSRNLQSILHNATNGSKMCSTTPPRQSRTSSTSRPRVVDNGLRLVVINGTYRKCKLFGAIKQLLFNSRRLSTKKSYNTKWTRFVNFCTLLQDETRSYRLESLSTTQTTLLPYIGFIPQEGQIRSSSLYSYLN